MKLGKTEMGLFCTIVTFDQKVSYARHNFCTKYTFKETRTSLNYALPLSTHPRLLLVKYQLKFKTNKTEKKFWCNLRGCVLYEERTLFKSNAVHKWPSGKRVDVHKKNHRSKAYPYANWRRATVTLVHKNCHAKLPLIVQTIYVQNVSLCKMTPTQLNSCKKGFYVFRSNSS